MVLNYISIGDGPPVVLIHGIAGSLRYWNDIIPSLARNHRVIAVDLPGFGHSPNLKTGYSYEANISSIKETLDSIHMSEPFVLVGHSMGGLIALRYAATYESTVSKLVLISMPVYKTSSQAKQDIINNKKYLEYAYYGLSSQMLCNVWCRLLRPASRHIAPYYLQKLPRNIAQDSVLHSWKAFSGNLQNVIQDQSAVQDLAKLSIDIKLLYGNQERPLVLTNVKKTAKSLKSKNNISLEIIEGSHHLPLIKINQVVDIIN